MMMSLRIIGIILVHEKTGLNAKRLSIIKINFVIGGKVNNYLTI
jgi:hypothetical protein